MLRALLVDDEAPARQVIREYLLEHPEIEVIGEAENGSQALAAILTLRPDLVFLDIQMPGLNGFEVLAQARHQAETLPAVVFSTAYDEFALRAFEVNAVDYLLKPFDRARFRAAIERVTERRSGTGEELARIARLLAATIPQASEEYPEFLMVRSGNRIVPVRTADIERIEAADNYALLHTGEASYITSSGIGTLERKLSPGLFMRVHRSAIINVTLVRHIEPDGSGGMLATMRSGAAVKVSRGHAPGLRKLFV